MSWNKSELPLKILFATTIIAILSSLEPVKSLIFSLI